MQPFAESLRIFAQGIRAVSKTDNTTRAPEASARSRGQRLKRLRNLANLPRKIIAEHYDININTLKGWEIGRHGGLTKKGAQHFLQLLSQHGVKCELEWLLFGTGAPPTVHEIFSAASSTAEPNDDAYFIPDSEPQCAHELALFQQQAPTLHFRVSDDAMAPKYQCGDYVAGIKRHDSHPLQVLHLDCIVETTTGEILLRHVRDYVPPLHYTLLALNPYSTVAQPTRYEVPLRSAAPVIWHRRRDPV